MTPRGSRVPGTRRRCLLGAALGGLLAASCATIAGLDEDFQVGEPGTGGSQTVTGAGATGASGAGGAPTGSPTGAGTGSGTGAGTGGGTGAGTGGGTGAGTGSGTGAGTGSGTGTGTGSGTGTGTGSGTGTGTGAIFQVPCAATICTVGQVCCVTQPPNVQNGCAWPGACGGGEFEVRCNGPEDCPSPQVCCGVYNGSGWTSMHCASSCSNYGAGERVICGNNSGNCPPSNPTCIASGALPGYFWCS